MSKKELYRTVRSVYTITLAGKRPINTFATEGNLIDLIGYLDRNYFNISDLVKLIKTEYTINQYATKFERFKVVENITDKVVSDTIPKILGKRAEKLNFTKLEKL